MTTRSYSADEIEARIGLPAVVTPFATFELKAKLLGVIPLIQPAERTPVGRQVISKSELAQLCHGRFAEKPFVLQCDCYCIAFMVEVERIYFIETCDRHSSEFENASLTFAARRASRPRAFQQTATTQHFVTPEILISRLGSPRKIGVIPYSPRGAQNVPGSVEAGTFDMEPIEDRVESADELRTLCKEYLAKGHGLLMKWECSVGFADRGDCLATTYNQGEVWELLAVCRLHRSEF